jgi:K+-transporting ATPase ATPase A chain
MTRCLFYILLPIAFVFGIIFVGEGAVQTLAGTASFHDVLNNVSQTIARGPIGFMETIKQLGTNGSGFLNANSATPFENPTGLTNFLSIWLLLSIPVALTYTFGKMVGSIKHGFALLPSSSFSLGCGLATPRTPSTRTTPRLPRRALSPPLATPRARRSDLVTRPRHSLAWRQPQRQRAPRTPPTTPLRPSEVWVS